MSRVLIVSHEELKPQMSGPSIRNWELATALAETHQVTLAVPGEAAMTHPAAHLVGYSDGDLPALVESHDVVQTYGFVLYKHPVVATAARLVIDLYGPFQLEGLHRHAEHSLQRLRAMATSDRAAVLDLVRAGDVFLCASERQRDFWLGWLDAAGRVNPDTHGVDPGFTSMVRIVPFGLPSEPPQPGPNRFRGVIPGIDKDDFVVLWGGASGTGSTP